MNFKAYPTYGQTPYVFYVEGMQGVKISKRQGALHVSGSDSFTHKRIEKFLLEQGIDITAMGLREFNEQLADKGLLSSGSGRQRQQTRSFTQRPETFQSTGSFDAALKKTPERLSFEASQLDLKTCPFRNTTIKDTSVIISSNEPRALEALFQQTRLSQISYAHLPVADVVATNVKTGDTLFIERKTTHDLYDSVNNNQRSHDQCERMFDAVNEIRAQGKRARAIWIIESQSTENALLHSTLSTIQAVDGLINYLDLISDQSVHQSYCMKHSVYMMAKYIQGFFEQKLYYSVKSSNPSIMRSKKDRIAAKSIIANEERDSGVTHHTSDALHQMLSYIPHINTAVAKELANTGKSFAEILQMSQSELEEIKGIGKKSAEKIANTFNTRTLPK